ncbi:hypothetical protein AVEN_136087-1 [Araneus ventricosus]|uniref:Uncharacterized protein n=1 Tax=Araneus ventricosus TaxID=182803 RepID=A0A4Y2WW74_ARAVE|nr:hypothetical protein AVEN_136087-1 [Araneus ventricosus]
MYTDGPQIAGGVEFSVCIRNKEIQQKKFGLAERLVGLTWPTLSPARLQLDCSENVNEEAVEQWINEDSTLECCEVLSDDDIVSRVTCGSEETRIFEECPESVEEDLVTHQK